MKIKLLADVSMENSNSISFYIKNGFVENGSLCDARKKNCGAQNDVLFVLLPCKELWVKIGDMQQSRFLTGLQGIL